MSLLSFILLESSDLAVVVGNMGLTCAHVTVCIKGDALLCEMHSGVEELPPVQLLAKGLLMLHCTILGLLANVQTCLVLRAHLKACLSAHQCCDTLLQRLQDMGVRGEMLGVAASMYWQAHGTVKMVVCSD